MPRSGEDTKQPWTFANPLINQLVMQGDLERAVDAIDKIYRQSYDELFRRESRNYMKPGHPPHPLVNRLGVLLMDEKSKQMGPVRLAELGPGVGNDASYLLSQRAVDQYVGIESSGYACMRARQQIKTTLAGLGGTLPQAEVHNEDYVGWAKQQAKTPATIFEGGSPTNMLSISTLHYFPEKRFQEILQNLCRILAPTRGLLAIALKTPKSASYRQAGQWVVSRDPRYPMVYNPKEGIVRAFLEKDVLQEHLEAAGFDIQITREDKVMGYDHDGEEEVFNSVVAKAVNPAKI